MSKIPKYSFTLNVNQVVFQKLHELHEERCPNAEFNSFVEYILATFIIDNNRVLWDGINSCLVMVPTPAGYYENEPVWAADDDDAIAYGDGKGVNNPVAEVTITDDDNDDNENYPPFWAADDDNEDYPPFDGN